MSQQFEEMKKKIVEENEKSFGEEVREKYGQEAYEESTNIIMGLTEEKWIKSENLRQKAESMLKDAVKSGDPYGHEAIDTAKAHGEWASTFWEDGKYSAEAHTLLASLYTEDQRFKNYYDSIVSGGAEFLRKAIENYCSKQ